MKDELIFGTAFSDWCWTIKDLAIPSSCDAQSGVLGRAPTEPGPSHPCDWRSLLHSAAVWQDTALCYFWSCSACADKLFEKQGKEMSLFNLTSECWCTKVIPHLPSTSRLAEFNPDTRRNMVLLSGPLCSWGLFQGLQGVWRLLASQEIPATLLLLLLGVFGLLPLLSCVSCYQWEQRPPVQGNGSAPTNAIVFK